MSVVIGAQPVEYVEESTLAQAESNPDMNWVGYVTSFEVIDSVEVIDNKTLSADPGTTLVNRSNIKDREAYSITMNYVPQNLDFIQYVTGANGGISRDLTPIQFGQQDQNNGEYRRIMGCIGETAEITIEQDSVVNINQEFLVLETTDWTGTDYIGSGSHASEDTSDALKYGDVGEFSLNNTLIDDYINGITITIENELQVTHDVNSSLSTEISAVKPVDKTVAVEFNFVYDDMSVSDLVSNFDSNRLTFEVGSDVVEINDIQFTELPQPHAREQTMGGAVPSTMASDMSWGQIANKTVSMAEVVGSHDNYQDDWYFITISESIGIVDRVGSGYHIAGIETISGRAFTDEIRGRVLSEIMSISYDIANTKTLGLIGSEVLATTDTLNFIKDLTMVLDEVMTLTQLDDTYEMSNLQGGSGNEYWIEVDMSTDNTDSPSLSSVTYDSDNNILTADQTFNSQSIDVTVYEDVGADGSGPSTDPNGKSYDNNQTVTLESPKDIPIIRKSAIKSVQTTSGVATTTGRMISHTAEEVVGMVDEIINTIVP